MRGLFRKLDWLALTAIVLWVSMIVAVAAYVVGAL
jgi:hypothetical protein